MPKIANGLRVFSKVLRTIFIVLAIYFAIIALFMKFTETPGTRAAAAEAQKREDAKRQEMYNMVNDPRYSRTKETQFISDLNKVFLCLSVGELCTDNPKDAAKFQEQSATGQMAKLFTVPFSNPPASGIYWVADSLERTGFVPKTYAAQGTGFASIKPLYRIWLAFRNVTYLLLVLVIVTIGFFIIFRFKINPQTTINLENALPRIIITLILITFSFAIAGFMIDLMYFITLIGISVIARGDPTFSGAQIAAKQSSFITANSGDLFDALYSVDKSGFFGGWQRVYDLGNAIFYVLPQWIQTFIRGITIAIVPIVMWRDFGHFGDTVGSVAENIGGGGGVSIAGFGGTVQAHLGRIAHFLVQSGWTYILWTLGVMIGLIWGPGLILGFLVFITLIGLFFRLFFLLFQAYLRITLSIIFAPILLTANMIPGNNSFTTWFRKLAGELSMFPVTVFIIFTAKLIIDIQKKGDFWRPPYLHGVGASSLAILIGMGIVYILPDILKQVRTVISGQKQPGLGFGLGSFIGGVAVASGGGLGVLGKYGSIAHGLSYGRDSWIGKKIFGEKKPTG